VPVGALLAPILAGVLETSLGLEAGALAAGTLGGGLLAGGLGAASGALESEITGGKPGIGALTGGVTSGLTEGLGPALGTSANVGEALVGGAAGAGTAALTGGNPLIGGIGGAVSPLAGGALLSGSSGAPAAPTTNVVSAPTASGAASPAASGGSVGAASAAANTQIGLDPTATGAGSSGGGAAPSGGGGISGGGARVDGLSGDPNAVLDATGGTGFLSPTGSGGSGGGLQSLIDKFTSNPAMLLNAAPLALQLFGGGQTPLPAERQLQTLATNAGSQGAALTGFATSGTLPAGGQQVVDAQRKANEAKVRSTFGRLGLAGSTMESQALQEAGSQSAGQQFMLSQSFLEPGLRSEAIAAGADEQILRTQLAQDQAFNTSLANFARALGGFPAGTQPTTPVA
jgi:hypothetical protein